MARTHHHLPLTTSSGATKMLRNFDLDSVPTGASKRIVSEGKERKFLSIDNLPLPYVPEVQRCKESRDRHVEWELASKVKRLMLTPRIARNFSSLRERSLFVGCERL